MRKEPTENQKEEEVCSVYGKEGGGRRPGRRRRRRREAGRSGQASEHMQGPNHTESRETSKPRAQPSPPETRGLVKGVWGGRGPSRAYSMLSKRMPKLVARRCSSRAGERTVPACDDEDENVGSEETR
eukprot:1335246-Pleurochrysis_carterae.AAC.1